MSTSDIKVPDIGGSTDVEVIELCVAAGDTIAVDDVLVVLESDKATMEIPASAAGDVLEMKLAVGDKVSEGDVIVLIEPADAISEQESVSAAAKAENEEDAIEQAPVKAEREPEAVSGSDIKTVSVPDTGSSDKVTVIEVTIKVGDAVEEDETLIVVESDKATMEIPSPHSGTVEKLLVKEGDTVGTDDPIVELMVKGKRGAPTKEKTVDSEPAPKAETIAQKGAPTVAHSTAEASVTTHGIDQKVHAGPAVRKLAREFGVDLVHVVGSGPKNRILKEDVQAFVKAGLKQGSVSAGAVGQGIPSITLPDFSQFGVVEHTPLSRIHKLTAENMHKSWLNVPHVTQFDEADITDMEAFRKSQKAVAEAKGTKLTPLPFILKACAYAMNRYPQFNVSIDMDSHELIQKRYINIGVAVDTPAGLVVPVIRDVDKKSLWQLAEECIDLAGKAKDKKLKPAEMQGGCFTISSLGSVGGTAFTPIVNTPEVAILGLSKASIKPVWDGSEFLPRLMLPLSLSYDHRAVNGADAARFTALLGVLLGDLRQLLL
ncbi:dihydrolipoyllysine-residue acetyltransferase [Alkalimarinus alittae]|uniref:Acetyltransferase component of pyruvate dehydrogenase complex n=1 Tax=Alkalimarinus alittae TaxID=2961619 RepID=A0ABY6N449_9ALTE|nr:dihydrolipoyllysine-residue acetyltransferase [Alkalimarinus alittae]UZE96873.1 dihydrolipoyllysine-residue acetyltransferase [Alkalimarinus alittae]